MNFPNPYHLDESTFISRDVGRNVSFLFHFSVKFVKANRIAPDGTPRHIWGYFVSLCPIKMTPSQYGLIEAVPSHSMRIILYVGN